jgi:hypothetical protein
MGLSSLFSVGSNDTSKPKPANSRSKEEPYVPNEKSPCGKSNDKSRSSEYRSSLYRIPVEPGATKETIRWRQGPQAHANRVTMISAEY